MQNTRESQMKAIQTLPQSPQNKMKPFLSGISQDWWSGGAPAGPEWRSGGSSGRRWARTQQPEELPGAKAWRPHVPSSTVSLGNRP